MSLFYRTNYIPPDFFTAIWQWKEDLKTNGWIVYASGTGTGGTFSAGAKGTSRDLLTAPAMFNAATLVWFAIHDSAQNRSFVLQCFQRDDLWRVKYSTAAGFVGGSASANQVPSATDEVVMYGTGSDSSPGSSQLFPGFLGGTRRTQTIIDPSDDSFIYWTYPPNGNMESCLMVDTVINPSAGDLDPAVLCIYGNSPGMGTAVNQSAAGFISTELTDVTVGVNGSVEGAWAAWMQKGGANQRYSRMAAAVLHTQQGPIFPGGGSGNAFTLKDDLWPVTWGRRSDSPGPGGYKGISKWLYYNSVQRITGQALSITSPTARDYIHASRNLAVKFWNGTYGLG
jgi:hypothetical protein